MAPQQSEPERVMCSATSCVCSGLPSLLLRFEIGILTAKQSKSVCSDRAKWIETCLTVFIEVNLLVDVCSRLSGPMRCLSEDGLRADSHVHW